MDKDVKSSLNNLVTWIQFLEKERQTHKEWIGVFQQRQREHAKAINALIEKDQVHDQKDAEHTTLIESIKGMAKAIEQTEGEQP